MTSRRKLAEAQSKKRKLNEVVTGVESNNESDSALSIINSMKKKDRNSVPLLIWILARDINAIRFIKDGKNLKTLGIWDNQINMYKRISDRTSRESNCLSAKKVSLSKNKICQIYWPNTHFVYF